MNCHELVQTIKKDPDDIDSDFNMEEIAPVPCLESKLEVSMETIKEPPEDHTTYFESVMMKENMIHFKEEDSSEGLEFPYRPDTLENEKKELEVLEAHSERLTEMKTEEFDLKQEDITSSDKLSGVETEFEDVVQTIKNDPDEVDSKCNVDDIISIPPEIPCLEPKVEISILQTTYPETKIISEQFSSNSPSQNRTEEWIASAPSIQQHTSTTAYVSSQLSNLKVHMNVDSNEKSFSDRQCDSLFSDKSNLKSNMNFDASLMSVSCTECGKLFARKDTLKVHMNVHTGDKPFSCNECGKLFTRKHSLKVHMNIHSGHKPFSCNLCGKLFTQKNSLKSHMNIHAGHKPFSCNECGKLFSNRSHLKDHKNIHSGDKPFSCDVCGKLFTYRSNLKGHLNLHAVNKPFSCNECGKSFSYKNHLEDHKKIHYGYKPFSCKICGKLFTQKQHLKVHMNVHTGDKPFSCSDCGKLFSDKSNLKVHIRIHSNRNSKRSS